MPPTAVGIEETEPLITVKRPNYRMFVGMGEWSYSGPQAENSATTSSENVTYGVQGAEDLRARTTHPRVRNREGPDCSLGTDAGVWTSPESHQSIAKQ